MEVRATVTTPLVVSNDEQLKGLEGVRLDSTHGTFDITTVNNKEQRVADGTTASRRSAMSISSFGLFGGMIYDLRGRFGCYANDWTWDGISILAPASTAFFSSVIPALTFGEQIDEKTNATFGVQQVGIILSVYDETLLTLRSSEGVLGAFHCLVSHLVSQYRYSSQHLYAESYRRCLAASRYLLLGLQSL